jgi:hypothetical protein
VDKNALIKLLAYTIIKCNTPGIKSIVKFISMFRHKTVATSEESYYVLMFSKAIAYIENIKQEDINISKKDFNFFVDEFEKKELIVKNKSKHCLI